MLKTVSVAVATGGSSSGNLTITDNVTTINNVTQITINGGHISGNSANLILNTLGGVSPPFNPQGRLYLQSNFGVQNSDQVNVSTIYYAPYTGQLVPVFNGNTWTTIAVPGQISMGLDAVTPHVAGNNCYDIFAIDNSGSIALCIGPAWNYNSTVTISNASPAVITWTNHGLFEGAPVSFSTTGSLPTGITAATIYFVGKSPATNTFNVSTTISNAASGTFVNTSSAGSGTQTATNGTGGNGVATARGVGAGTTQLDLSKGLWTNAVSLTHAWGGASGTTDYGPIPANQATYLGTFFATANGQTGIASLPTPAAGGTNNILGLYNGYNREPMFAECRDSTASWTYGSTTWRATDNSVSNRITWVDGLQSSTIEGNTQVLMGPTGSAYTGMSLNSTTGAPQITSQFNAETAGAFYANVTDYWYPHFGLAYIQAMESSGNTTTFFGAQTSPARQSSALTIKLNL